MADVDSDQHWRARAWSERGRAPQDLDDEAAWKAWTIATFRIDVGFHVEDPEAASVYVNEFRARLEKSEGFPEALGHAAEANRSDVATNFCSRLVDIYITHHVAGSQHYPSRGSLENLDAINEATTAAGEADAHSLERAGQVLSSWRFESSPENDKLRKNLKAKASLIRLVINGVRKTIGQQRQRRKGNKRRPVDALVRLVSRCFPQIERRDRITLACTLAREFVDQDLDRERVGSTIDVQRHRAR